MKVTPLRIVAFAFVAGLLGLVAGLWINGPGPLLGTEFGQRMLNDSLVAATPTPEGVPVAKRGETIPAVSIATLDGGTLRLPDAYAGQPVLINLWASWCGPCIEEMPELDRYAREQGTGGTQVLGIALTMPKRCRISCSASRSATGSPSTHPARPMRVCCSATPAACCPTPHSCRQMAVCSSRRSGHSSMARSTTGQRPEPRTGRARVAPKRD